MDIIDGDDLRDHRLSIGAALRGDVHHNFKVFFAVCLQLPLRRGMSWPHLEASMG
jgi:hypothetical protein